MSDATTLTRLRGFEPAALGAPILLMAVLAMLMLPVPPFALDLLFTFNITLALVVLLVTVYALRPLDFGVFPSVLLIATLMRLALNVASTRVVLQEGHAGTGAAGRVIEAFGEFVIGGNYAVGFVVFAILVIINFVVVTKGAGRVSEVSARFTLDAMPGKQIAIDADLNAGIIDQDTALERRAEIGQEADFYGAMDGASKFVRGDAVAGILILLINIVGGLLIGTLQHDLGAGEAFRLYSLLTIGDGLVAQIPSLLLSTATAIIVTRVSRSQPMGDQIAGQLFGSPQALLVPAVILGVLGLVPGMPNLVFLMLAAACGYAAHRLLRRRRAEALAATAAAEPAEAPAPKELQWDDIEPVDPIGLEVGYKLIPLVDQSQGGSLMGRIKGVRKTLSQQLGFLVPAVHIRDDLDLRPTAYRISLSGVTVASADVYPDRHMAICAGEPAGRVEGLPGKDPAFGLDALWVEASTVPKAQSLGYTVVDAATVIATHLSQAVQTHAHELFGYDEAQKLLDRLAVTTPKLVEDLVPNLLPLSAIVAVARNLLRDGVELKDFRNIAGLLAQAAARSQDPDDLTAAVRVGLARAIVQKISGLDDELPLITLAPELERILLQSSGVGGAGERTIEPGLAETLTRTVGEAAARQSEAGLPAVLVVSAEIRSWLGRLLRHAVPGLQVLSYPEIPEDRMVRVVASVGAPQETAA